MSLKQKTIRGLSWAFIDRFANQISQFIFGIILARLLSPAEYGLVGMLAIFFEVADTLVMAGFSEALIRKSDPSPKDYSTVFLVNVATGIIFYALLSAAAPPLAAQTEPTALRVVGDEIARAEAQRNPVRGVGEH